MPLGSAAVGPWGQCVPLVPHKDEGSAWGKGGGIGVPKRVRVQATLVTMFPMLWSRTFPGWHDQTPCPLAWGPQAAGTGAESNRVGSGCWRDVSPSPLETPLGGWGCFGWCWRCFGTQQGHNINALGRNGDTIWHGEDVLGHGDNALGCNRDESAYGGGGLGHGGEWLGCGGDTGT